MKAIRHHGLLSRSFLLLLAGTLLGAGAAGTACARETLIFGGAEGGGGGTSSYYTFVGGVAPLLDNSFGNGFMQKYKVDFQGYDYPSDGRKVQATAVGVEGAVGYVKSGENGWAGAYAGLRYSETWLSPDDPKSSVRGSQLRPMGQLEGERVLSSDWRINGLASYIFISDSYWGRGRVMYRAYDRVYTGPEFIAQGDPSYRAWSGGWFVTGFQPIANSSLGLRAGVRKIEKTDPGGYLGIEFSRTF